MLEILIDKPFEYTLSRDDSGRLLLEVLSGGKTESELVVVLDPAESRRYAQEGERFIDALAHRVAAAPSEFHQRAIHPE